MTRSSPQVTLDFSPAFSKWPPNWQRMAERSLFAKFASPRALNRSYSALVRTGTGAASSIAAFIVQRPSPEPETLLAKEVPEHICAHPSQPDHPKLHLQSPHLDLLQTDLLHVLSNKLTNRSGPLSVCDRIAQVRHCDVIPLLFPKTDDPAMKPFGSRSVSCSLL